MSEKSVIVIEQDDAGEINIHFEGDEGTMPTIIAQVMHRLVGDYMEANGIEFSR